MSLWFKKTAAADGRDYGNVFEYLYSHTDPLDPNAVSYPSGNKNQVTVCKHVPAACAQNAASMVFLACAQNAMEVEHVCKNMPTHMELFWGLCLSHRQ